MDDRVRGIINRWGFTSVFWDMDTNDWTTDGAPTQIPTAKKAFTANLAAPALKTTGVIALEHDYFSGGVALFTGTFYQQILNAGFKYVQMTDCLNVPSWTFTQTPATKTVVGASATTAGNATVNVNGTSFPVQKQSSAAFATGLLGTFLIVLISGFMLNLN